MFCCSEALFRCGNTYYCEYHHNNYGRCVINDCGGVNCPLGVPHPPASEDPLKSMYPLGCSLCRVKTKGNYVGTNGAVAEVGIDKVTAANSKYQKMYVKYNPLFDKI